MAEVRQLRAELALQRCVHLAPEGSVPESAHAVAGDPSAVRLGYVERQSGVHHVVLYDLEAQGAIRSLSLGLGWFCFLYRAGSDSRQRVYGSIDPVHERFHPAENGLGFSAGAPVAREALPNGAVFVVDDELVDLVSAAGFAVEPMSGAPPKPVDEIRATWEPQPELRAGGVSGGSSAPSPVPPPSQATRPRAAARAAAEAAAQRGGAPDSRLPTDEPPESARRESHG